MFGKGTTFGALALLGLVAPGAAPCLADVLQTRDGEILAGRIVAATEAGVTIEVEGATAFVPAARIEPFSFYEARKRFLDPADGPARHALARFCQSEGLWDAARREYRESARLDPSLAPAVELRLAEIAFAHGQSLFEQGIAAHARGDHEAAARALARLVETYPDHPLAAPAQGALARSRRALSAADAPRSAPEADRGPAVARETERESRILRLIERAEEKISEGRSARTEAEAAASKGQVTLADRAFERTDSAFRQAVAALEEALGASRDLAQRGEFEKRVSAAREELAGVELARARLAAASGNWKSAYRRVRSALALDPGNPEAEDLRREVEGHYRPRSLKEWLNLQDRVEGG
ncbi:MAG: hypothetical protein HY720_17865 [Planctomycetes bacterium]|nr:hypothetical protein [Planctomycetota bacterium]